MHRGTTKPKKKDTRSSVRSQTHCRQYRKDGPYIGGGCLAFSVARAPISISKKSRGRADADDKEEEGGGGDLDVPSQVKDVRGGFHGALGRGGGYLRYLHVRSQI